MSEIGKTLRTMRQERGWTLQELGERAGVPWNTVARIERGVVVPRWDTVEKLAAALGWRLTFSRPE